MTVVTELCGIVRNSTGAETSFNTGFTAEAANHVRVIVSGTGYAATVLTRALHYQSSLDVNGILIVTPTSKFPTGTLLSPRLVRIERVTPATQESDLANDDPYDQELLEKNLDRQMRVSQEARRDIATYGTAILNAAQVAADRAASQLAALAAQAAAVQAELASGLAVATFESLRAVETVNVNALLDVLWIAGGWEPGDGGACLLVREPALVDPLGPGRIRTNGNTVEWRISATTLTYQMFARTAKFGSGADDTPAFIEAHLYAIENGAPIQLVKTAEKPRCGPITMPNGTGLTIRGAGPDSGYITARDPAQAHVFNIPYGSINTHLQGLYFSFQDLILVDGLPVDARRPVWAIIDQGSQGTQIRDVKVYSCASGVWFYSGGYKYAENIFVGDAILRSFAFGGNYNGITGSQCTQSEFYGLADDAALSEGQENLVRAGSVSFDFLAGAAFLELQSSTGAGRQIGMRCYDNFTGVGDTRTDEQRLNARPDGIYFTLANNDWAGTHALQVLHGTRIQFIAEGNLRSLNGAAIALGQAGVTLGTIAINNSRVYASRGVGILVQGNIHLLDIVNSHIISNSYPNNAPGSIGLHVVAGTGIIRMTAGRIGAAAAGLSEYGATNVQQFGLIVDAGATFDITLEGVDMAGNATPFTGIVDGSGYLKSNIHLYNINTPGAASRRSGQFTGTPNGSGEIKVPHALACRPRYFNGNIPFGSNKCTPQDSDSTDMIFVITDASNNAVTSGSFTVRWDAAV
jgi:hypothetical protein